MKTRFYVVLFVAIAALNVLMATPALSQTSIAASNKTEATCRQELGEDFYTWTDDQDAELSCAWGDPGHNPFNPNRTEQQALLFINMANSDLSYMEAWVHGLNPANDSLHLSVFGSGEFTDGGPHTKYEGIFFRIYIVYNHDPSHEILMFDLGRDQHHVSGAEWAHYVFDVGSESFDLRIESTDPNAENSLNKIDLSELYTQRTQDTNSAVEEVPDDFGFGDVSTYPNPAVEEFNITGLPDWPVEIFVYDLLGRAVIRETRFTGQRLRASHLPAGTYFMRIRDQQRGFHVTKPFLVGR